MKKVDRSKSLADSEDHYVGGRGEIRSYDKELARVFEDMLKSVDSSESSEEFHHVKLVGSHTEITYFYKSKVLTRGPTVLKRKRKVDDVVVVDDDEVSSRKHRRLDLVTQPQAPPLCDFLGAVKLGKKNLLGSYGKGLVDVETLRGKINGLYFASLSEKVLVDFIQCYNALKKNRHGSFEMIFVVLPTWPIKEALPADHYDSMSDEFYNSSVFNEVISLMPCPIVPFTDEDWRSHLYRSYANLRYFPSDLTFIDTKNNTVNVLSQNAYHYLHQFGPRFYPFTKDRIEQLNAQQNQLGKKTCLQDILGSESRDYLIDRHSNEVPISLLQNKDVLLYPCGMDSNVQLEKYLKEIYSHFDRDSFEIVSINIDYNCGSEDEHAFYDNLAKTPWLSMPFGDDKIWSLRHMMTSHPCVGEFYDYPVLFVKPRGRSLLDPWGCHVIKKFGIQAYPFSRLAAAQSLLIKQTQLSFKSFVDTANHLGHNFNTLIRNKSDGETEPVSLSSVMEKQPTAGILLFFASLLSCSKERLESLISAYSKQKKSSSFEVIFVSTDKDLKSFGKHFSSMPWYALSKPLNRKEVRNLAVSTIEIDFWHYNHFLAFGPDRSLLKAGLVAKSFENCDFPFIKDAEWIDHLLYRIEGEYGWSAEADGSTSHRGHRWTRGLEYDYRSLIHEERDPMGSLDQYWDNGDLPESLLKEHSVET